MNLEQFKSRYGKVNRPEDVDPAFELMNISRNCIYNDSVDYDDWAWIESLPPQFYRMAESVVDDVASDDHPNKETFCVKVYERLLFIFQNPEVFFVSDVIQEESTQEDNLVQDNFFNKSNTLPKHIVDILEVCGNHVLKPIGDNANLFTYLHVESLAEEIQAIIDEYKQGN